VGYDALLFNGLLAEDFPFGRPARHDARWQS
jgi:hypothetical protein